MTDKLFFSQELINSWTDDTRVKFENDKLSIDSPRGPQEYTLTPAYRVIKTSDDSPDPHGVLDTVYTQQELEAKGADIYLNSGIIGETPYDIEPGYVAEKADDEANLNKVLMDYLAKTLI